MRALSGQVGSPVQFDPRVERWHWVSGRQLQQGGGKGRQGPVSSLSSGSRALILILRGGHVCTCDPSLRGQQRERRTSEPASVSVNGLLSPPYFGPFVQVGPQGLEGWPIHFPPRMPNAAGATAAAAAVPPPIRDFQPVTPVRVR